MGAPVPMEYIGRARGGSRPRFHPNRFTTGRKRYREIIPDNRAVVFPSAFFERCVSCFTFTVQAVA